MSLRFPAGVSRWLRVGGLVVDPRATDGIASSRNLTAVAMAGQRRVFIKLAATPDDPWSAREAALLTTLGGGGPRFRTPTVVRQAPGRLALSWMSGATAYARRRRRPSVGARDDAEVGRALAHFHARWHDTGAPVGGALADRLLWTSPAEYAAMSGATIGLWREVQRQRRVERTLLRLLTGERARPPVLCHGDFRQANVFISRGSVGFVDLELAGLGDPARDLGAWAADALGAWLAPRDAREALSLPQLRRGLCAFVTAWERAAAGLGLPGRAGVRARTMAWAGEALVRRAYTVTVHEGTFGERDAHVLRSALGLLSTPGRWARHFLGAP